MVLSTTSDFQKPTEPKLENVYFFVIHGIGCQNNFLKRNVVHLNTTFQQVIATKNLLVQVHLIPIEWHSLLHKLNTVDRRLDSITTPHCAWLKQLNNHFMADILYYFTNFHGQQIVNLITEKLNEGYDDIIKKHPDFKGRIGIYAHSLGGICCYDILANQDKTRNGIQYEGITYAPLRFKTSFLFTIGSPIAAAIAIRGQDMKQYQVPSYCTYQNIYHPYDPLGYRMEPLLNSDYTFIEPVKIKKMDPVKSSLHERFKEHKETIEQYLPTFSIRDAKQKLARPFHFLLRRASMPRVPSETGHLHGATESHVLRKRHLSVEEGDYCSSKKLKRDFETEAPSSNPNPVPPLLYQVTGIFFSFFSRKNDTTSFLNFATTDCSEYHTCRGSRFNRPSREMHQRTSSGSHQGVATQPLQIRYDFAFDEKKTFIAAAQECFFGIWSHFSYWSSKDLAFHILTQITKG